MLHISLTNRTMRTWGQARSLIHLWVSLIGYLAYSLCSVNICWVNTCINEQASWILELIQSSESGEKAKAEAILNLPFIIWLQHAKRTVWDPLKGTEQVLTICVPKERIEDWMSDNEQQRSSIGSNLSRGSSNRWHQGRKIMLKLKTEMWRKLRDHLVYLAHFTWLKDERWFLKDTGW